MARWKRPTELDLWTLSVFRQCSWSLLHIERALLSKHFSKVKRLLCRAEVFSAIRGQPQARGGRRFLVESLWLPGFYLYQNCELMVARRRFLVAINGVNVFPCVELFESIVERKRCTRITLNDL